MKEDNKKQTNLKEQKNEANVKEIKQESKNLKDNSGNEKKESVKQDEQANNKVEENKQQETKKKNKLRRNLVLVVFIVALAIIYIIERGEYLEIKEIGENYISMFWQNVRNIGITAILNFSIIFTVMYVTTTKIKNGLKTFFEDEKKIMPKLPQKSISFIVAILVTIFTSNLILEKALPCFYNTQFVTTDSVFGLDIGYFVFIWPFLELMH